MIKKVSNEELIEKFMLHVPQSVMGTSFPPSVIKATQNEIETLRTQLAKANDYTAELEVRKDALEESLNGCTEKVLSLSGKLAKANERVALLEQCVIKFRQGVTHFNRTRGDLNVLLSAYADCEQLRKEQSHD